MYTVLIKQKDILQEKLIELVDEPYDPLKNFNLALEYHKYNQTAIALSYYLRCAEFTDNKIISSEALLRASLCVNTQQGRDEKELYLIKHAITASPNSIEPYYVASLFYSWRSGNNPEKRFWLDSYQYACLGVNIIENGCKCEPFTTNFGYTEYNIYFQKAFAGSNIGKINEAQEIYTKILTSYELDINTKNYINSKLQQLPERKYSINKIKNTFNSSIFEIDDKLTTLNNYHNSSPAIFKLYRNCYLCDCIRRGYRWEEHQHDIVDKYLDKNSIAIEAGSHIGTLAVKLAKTCKLTYCFEPVINTYHLLQFNMKVNCDSSNYKLFNKGLGECIKNENISWISPHSACAIGLDNNSYNPLNNDEKNNAIKAGAKNIIIEITTIDTLKLDKLDYIKIDVEGYEQEVINGGLNTIKKCKPIIILECYETFSPSKVASLEYVKNKYKLLLDLGYEVKHVWLADFLFIPIKKLQKKAIVTFGTDYLFKNQKIRFKQQATSIDFFDDVIIEDEKSIKPLITLHEEFITKNKRGYGYWIWKPLIIKNTLEKMSNDDILFYIDCGSSLINNDLHKLTNYVNILKNHDIIVFEDSHRYNKQFIKYNVIKELNVTESLYNKPIIEGGCVIVKKSKFTIDFLDKWFEYMTKDNYSLVNDDLLNLEQTKDFIEHRHDQILLSILSRSYNNIYVGNGHEEVYNKGPIFHSRLTDLGPRQYAKPIPNIKSNFEKLTNYKNNNIIKKINPNLIVIDNFYDDPDKIRQYALSLNYQEPENHGAVGYRCESGRKILDGTKELFEKLLHANIPEGTNIGEWNYSTNGCFQWCNASVPIVYHCDSQKYAGIIYLTPDAPPECGTSFFRHKKYKLRNREVFSKSDWYQSDLNYKEPHLDKTQWEVVDSIGNVYNRLVIFDAQYIHGVSEYFGEDIRNSRLFQLFFFDITK